MISSKRQPWKQTWKSLKRKGLVDAVVRVLSREGIEGLTMENVALQAGVAKGTLYGYFKSKQDLLRAAIEAAIAPMLEELNAILSSSLPPGEKLTEMTFRHLSYFEENRNFFRIFLEDRIAAQQRLSRYRSCHYHNFLQRIASEIKTGVKSGLFRPVDPLKAAAVLVEADIAVINQRLLSDQPGPVKADAVLISDLFLHGIARREK